MRIRSLLVAVVALACTMSVRAHGGDPRPGGADAPSLRARAQSAPPALPDEAARLLARVEADERRFWLAAQHLAAVAHLEAAVRAAQARRSEPARSTVPAHGPGPAPAGCDHWAARVRALWPTDSAERMVTVMWRESRCRTDAVSPTGCLGLLQVCWPLHRARLAATCGTGERSALFDGECNLAVGLSLWREQGWAPWKATA